MVTREKLSLVDQSIKKLCEIYTSMMLENLKLVFTLLSRKLSYEPQNILDTHFESMLG